MKRLTFFIGLLLTFVSLTKAQNIEIATTYGTNNEHLNDILSFQNLSTQSFSFNGNGLKNKFYKVVISEFNYNKLVSKEVLFDASEDEYFKIKSNSLSLKFIASLHDQKLTIALKGNGFMSKKHIKKLMKNKGEHVLKDFFGRKEKLNLSITKSLPLLAIITPKTNNDGSSSYCEVVQSKYKPKELGLKYNMPQYFLIEINFN